ncbi:hypothetical protein GE543_18390 [Pseudomonas sp. SZ57]|nr:hypothetical protein [Pseudomonas sp. SZ57]
MLHAEAQTAPPQTLCRRVADSTGSWPLRDIYLLYTAVSRKRWRPENSGQPQARRKGWTGSSLHGVHPAIAETYHL